LTGGIASEVIALPILPGHEINRFEFDIGSEFGDRDHDDSWIGTHSSVKLHFLDSSFSV
jgi:hypothetical protein